MTQEMNKREKIAYWIGVHLVSIGFFLLCCVAAGVLI